MRKTSQVSFGFRTFPFVAALLVLTPLCWRPLDVKAQVRPDRDEVGPPTLQVTGRGETFATPDAATLRLGAVAEDEQAANAQAQVNEIMQRALKSLRDLKVPRDKIKTTGLSLSPVYEQQERPRGITRPRIIGYRARNTLQVDVQDLQMIGRIIDAGVAAGANQIEGLSFQLKKDQQARREALRLAVEEARAKADAIADAMGIRIKGVYEVIEGGVHVLQPRMEMGQARMAMGADMSTPVEPGEIRIEATVTVEYYINEVRP